MPIAASLAHQLWRVPPSLDTSAAGQQATDASDIALRAAAACGGQENLLGCCNRSLCQECELESDLVFQLASCASLALDAADSAVQLLYAHASAPSTAPGSQAAVASRLAYGCATISGIHAQRAAVVTSLEGRDPGPDLLAALDKGSVRCHHLGPILLWCLKQQGAALTQRQGRDLTG